MDNIFRITSDGNFIFDKELFGFYLKRGIAPVVNIVDLMNIRGYLDDEINRVFLEHIENIVKE
jgi:hypothetical protein